MKHLVPPARQCIRSHALPHTADRRVNEHEHVACQFRSSPSKNHLCAAGLVNPCGWHVLNPLILVAGNPEEWDRLLAINVSAPQRLIKYLCGPMIEREQGYVINIGSTNGLKPSAATPAYSASKWAMRGYSLGVTEVSPE